MPDPIVEAGTSNDPATGGNESLITLGKRAAESEASNDSANDEVSQKGALLTFERLVSPFWKKDEEEKILFSWGSGIIRAKILKFFYFNVFFV